MRVDYSAYEGMEVTGKVECVLSRGRLIVEDGEYLGKPGDGEFIRRGLNQYLI
jgi:dihydropyrimidinase